MTPAPLHQKMNSIRLRQPDDWHVHLRDEDFLTLTVTSSALCFRRAIVMPNLKPPVVTVEQAQQYKNRILKYIPENSNFEPLMVGYLTEATSLKDIETKYGFTAIKYYPAHATTNAEFGVKDLLSLSSALETMEKVGLPLLVHGEVTDPEVDIFDREAMFIDRVLIPLRRRFPKLKVVFEHITTQQAVDYVLSEGPELAATITPHHLMINRSSLFQGGLRPHLYCLPVAKREEHRQALRKAATSGNAKFFLGTDSAPHPRHQKESSCGCAGIFSAPFAMELYAQVFDEENALHNLEKFSSLNGPSFYSLPLNDSYIELERRPHVVPDSYPLPFNHEVIPFKAGESLGWSIKDSSRPA